MGGYNLNTEADTSMLLYSSLALLTLYHLGFEEVKSEVETKIRGPESWALECSTYLFTQACLKKGGVVFWGFFSIFRKEVKLLSGKKEKGILQYKLLMHRIY